jgi:hypothetical protein
MQMIAPCLPKAHLADMRARDTLQDKIAETDGITERDYAAWKHAKVEQGLAQAQQREKLIPLEQVLRDFGLEA